MQYGMFIETNQNRGAPYEMERATSMTCKEVIVEKKKEH